MTSPLIRSALMVRDLDRSRRFYERVFNLTTGYLDADLSDTIAWKLLGLPEDASVKCVILKPAEIDGKPAPNFGMIGLFELGDPSVDELRHKTDGIQFGESILVFYVDNLDRSLEGVVANGGKIMTGPEEFRLPNVSAMEAIVRDPDGVAINLVEAPDSVAW